MHFLNLLVLICQCLSQLGSGIDEVGTDSKECQEANCGVWLVFFCQKNLLFSKIFTKVFRGNNIMDPRGLLAGARKLGWQACPPTELGQTRKKPAFHNHFRTLFSGKFPCFYAKNLPPKSGWTGWLVSKSDQWTPPKLQSLCCGYVKPRTAAHRARPVAPGS